MKIPNIMITTLGLSDMEQACKCFAGTPLDKLKDTINDYAGISVDNREPDEWNVEFIVINQILYDDSKFIDVNEIDGFIDKTDFVNKYNELVEKYGQQFMDLIVIKDQNKIIENITNAINFIMDKVYKKNRVQILFNSLTGNMREQSDFPNLIYSALQQNFIIKSQKEYESLRIIKIEKGSNK